MPEARKITPDIKNIDAGTKTRTSAYSKTSCAFIMHFQAEPKRKNPLRSLHFARAQASGANIKRSRRAAIVYADPLRIGSPLFAAFAVRMAHLVAGDRPLLAYLTKLTHGYPSLGVLTQRKLYHDKT
jgi:hypothetical protein